MAGLNPPEPERPGAQAGARAPGSPRGPVRGRAAAGGPARRDATPEGPPVPRAVGREGTAPAARPAGVLARLARPLSGWRPWHGRPRARDLLCLAAIAASGIYTVATIPLTPALISTNPVLLELLTGSTTSVVAAGAFSAVDNKFQLAVVVAAALPGLMKFDWVFWWAGRLWGRRIVERLSQHSTRAASIAGVVERRGVRLAGPAVAVAAFVPAGVSTVAYAAAGWAGLSLLPFLLFDAIGTAIWTGLLAWAGYLLGKEGVVIANLVSRYALVTICVLAAATIAPNLWHAWRQHSRTRAALAKGGAATGPPSTLPPP